MEHLLSAGLKIYFFDLVYHLPAIHSLSYQDTAERLSIWLIPRRTHKIKISIPKSSDAHSSLVMQDRPSAQIRWGSFKLLGLYSLKLKERSLEFFLIQL